MSGGHTSGARSEAGTTLVFALLVVFGLLSLTIGGLVSARSDLRVSHNYRTGMQALMAAEGGLLHAKKVISGSGVIRFDTDVVPLWGTLFGTGPVTIAGYTGVSYDVTAANDAIDAAHFVRLRSIGRAPGEAIRTVIARFRLVGVYSPGAIYLPSTTVNPTFNGTGFLIDGTNRNLNGSTNTSSPSVPGIGTASQSTATTVLDALSSLQENRVLGIGGASSVLPADGASSERITNSIVPDILTRAGVVTNPPLAGIGNTILGTRLLPQITHFTGSVTINGNLSGAGIMIVDQGLTISGSVDFTGLIIVRGTTQITTVSGNATILGALWTTDVSLTVAGSASVTYSTEALALADALGGGDLLPQSVDVVAWAEEPV